MKKIKLFNRDGADLYLEYVKEISPKVSLWELIVDDDHKYCLEYMRVIAKDYSSKDIADWNIEAIDPSGGPFLSFFSLMRFTRLSALAKAKVLWMLQTS